MTSTKSQLSDWEARSRRLLKAELIRRDVSYAVLRDKLKAIGIEITEVNIRTKLSRGTFSAAFLLACMHAIGVTDVRLD